MERPTDAFKETHNLVVAVEDTYVGGLVSNLQVAELIACIASNRRTAYCKVVEAIAETTAPLLPTEDQLANIPSKRVYPCLLLAFNFSISYYNLIFFTVNIFYFKLNQLY